MLWLYSQCLISQYLHIILLIHITELINILSYDPLGATMKQKGITQYFLLKSGIDNKTLDSLKKNKNITFLTVEKLCSILECTPNDIVVFK